MTSFFQMTKPEYEYKVCTAPAYAATGKSISTILAESVADGWTPWEMSSCAWEFEAQVTIIFRREVTQ